MTAAPWLHGLRVLEFQAAGPVPFCGMLLADMGADVVVVGRAAVDDQPYTVDPARDVLHRGKRRIALDLKSDAGRAAALDLGSRADAVLEGFRPGVMERLGLGPDVLLAHRPALVYARVSGYGRGGPDAQRPGHDLNFLAESGALHAMGDADRVPTPPLNLIADFGGAGSLAATGVLGALLHARGTGRGQVVDVSMLQATRVLLASICSWRAAGLWNDERGRNFLDGSCPWYAVYRAQDGPMLAVASLEPPFYARLVEVLALQDFATSQWDRSRWAALRDRMRATFATRPRSHWLDRFTTQPACVSPVDPLPTRDADGWFTAAGVLQPQGAFGPVSIPQEELSSAEDPTAVLARWPHPAQ